MAQAPAKAVLIYDGECRFCAMLIARWGRCAGDSVKFIPYQSPEIAGHFPELPPERLEEAVHFIATDGSVFRGAEAVFLSVAAGNRVPLWLYRNVPGFGACAEFVYRRVANNRPLLSRLALRLRGRNTRRP